MKHLSTTTLILVTQIWTPYPVKHILWWPHTQCTWVKLISSSMTAKIILHQNCLKQTILSKVLHKWGKGWNIFSLISCYIDFRQQVALDSFRLGSSSSKTTNYPDDRRKTDSQQQRRSMNMDYLSNSRSRQDWRKSLNIDCEDVDHDNNDVNSDNPVLQFNTIPKREKRIRFNTYNEFSP